MTKILAMFKSTWNRHLIILMHMQRQCDHLHVWLITMNVEMLWFIFLVNFTLHMYRIVELRR